MREIKGFENYMITKDGNVFSKHVGRLQMGNRVIKFRGKRVDNGEWVYGYYVFYGHMGVFKHIIITNWAQVYTNSFYVETNTVGQYTGLKDKDGVEIYEGDIVRWINSDGESVHSVVEFVDGAFRVHNVCFTLWDYLDNDAEIIANIYGNPELMDGR